MVHLHAISGVMIRFLSLFANRGYACLQINFRGSTGYGKDFLAAGNGEWGAKMQDDLLDAVNWAIHEGIADPKKIAIYGASYGGYAALGRSDIYPRRILLRNRLRGAK